MTGILPDVPFPGRPAKISFISVSYYFTSREIEAFTRCRQDFDLYRVRITAHVKENRTTIRASDEMGVMVFENHYLSSEPYVVGTH